MSVGGIFSGVVLGALAGAGIGAIVPQFNLGYRAKAGAGPLSYQDCVAGLTRLRTKYPGITAGKTEGPRNAWMRPAVAVALFYLVLVAGAVLTYREHEALYPHRGRRPAVRAAGQGESIAAGQGESKPHGAPRCRDAGRSEILIQRVCIQRDLRFSLVS